jgi:phospholipase/carboxylesterase
MDWFSCWLDSVAPPERPVVLVGFSGGAAFAGGLLLDHPGRYAGAAILYGTLPFDAGVPTTHGRLSGVPVVVAQGAYDSVIPRELLDRTWSYVRNDSGAVAALRRDPVGHEIAPEVPPVLGSWLRQTFAAAAGDGAAPTT